MLILAYGAEVVGKIKKRRKKWELWNYIFFSTVKRQKWMKNKKQSYIICITQQMTIKALTSLQRICYE